MVHLTFSRNSGILIDLRTETESNEGNIGILSLLKSMDLLKKMGKDNAIGMVPRNVKLL